MVPRTPPPSMTSGRALSKGCPRPHGRAAVALTRSHFQKTIDGTKWAEQEDLASRGVVDHVEPRKHAVDDRPEDRRVIGPGYDDRQRGTESDPGSRDLGPDCHERLLPLSHVVW